MQLLPKDARIYIRSAYRSIVGNDNGLIDEFGSPGVVNAPYVGGGSSVAFDGAGWAAEDTPSAGTGGLVPVSEKTPSLLMMLGLAGLAAKGTSRNRETR